MNKILLSIAITAIAVGGGAFYGGMKYQKSNPPAGGPQRPQMLGANVGDFRNRSGANLAAGEIIAKDDKSITVQINSGGSKIVFYSSSTSVMKSATVTLNDLSVGEQITATGSSNSDGSITANTIQIRPAGSVQGN